MCFFCNKNGKSKEWEELGKLMESKGVASKDMLRLEKEGRELCQSTEDIESEIVSTELKFLTRGMLPESSADAIEKIKQEDQMETMRTCWGVLNKKA